MVELFLGEFHISVICNWDLVNYFYFIRISHVSDPVFLTIFERLFCGKQ